VNANPAKYTPAGAVSPNPIETIPYLRNAQFAPKTVAMYAISTTKPSFLFTDHSSLITTKDDNVISLRTIAYISATSRKIALLASPLLCEMLRAMTKARKNNEGCIYQRSDGRWEARISTPEGRKSFYGHTAEEVRAKMFGGEVLVRGGAKITTDRMTVEKFFTIWFDTVLPMKDLTANTIASYKKIAMYYLIPRLGTARLDRLQPSDVQACWVALKQKKKSPATIAVAKAVLSSMLKTAEQWGYTQRNAAAVTETPRRKPYDAPTISIAQAKSLLERIVNDKCEAAIVLGLLGLRSGEARALRWRDVDFKDRVLHIRQGVTSYDGEFHIGDPKRGSKRPVPMPSFVVAALERQKIHIKALRDNAGPQWVEHSLVLPALNGGYRQGNHLLYDVRRTMRTLGLPESRFHDLRHHFSTVLTALDVHPRIIMALMGHSTMQQSVDYARPSLDNLRKVMDDVDEALA
jgi:integrase